MNRMNLVTLVAIGVLGAAGCGANHDRDGSGSAAVNEGKGKGNGGPFTGAIFTTTKDGSVVNENHYDDCRDVYLNGGPKGGQPGLPEGDYYFMVTDPAGKTLLSSDGIGARKVHVDGSGEISAYTGSGGHDTGVDTTGGGVTVQLWPFTETPNNGGVYKAWLTPVDQYQEGKGKHGFLNRWSKTDNFKCEPGTTPPGDAGPPPSNPPEEPEEPEEPCNDGEC